MGDIACTRHPRSDHQLGYGNHGDEVEWAGRTNFWQGSETKDKGGVLPQHILSKVRTMHAKSQGY